MFNSSIGNERIFLKFLHNRWGLGTGGRGAVKWAGRRAGGRGRGRGRGRVKRAEGNVKVKRERKRDKGEGGVRGRGAGSRQIMGREGMDEG